MPNPQPSNPKVSYQIAGAGISTINQYGLGDNITGDKVMGDKIMGNKVVTSTQTQAIAQALQDLFNRLSQNHSQPLVAAKAIEAIDADPSLRQGIMQALKTEGITPLKALVKSPALDSVLAAVRSYPDFNA